MKFKRFFESIEDKIDSLKRLRDHPNTSPQEKDAAERALGRISGNQAKTQQIRYSDPTSPEDHPHHDVLIKHGFKNVGTNGYTHSYIHTGSGDRVNIDTRQPRINWTANLGKGRFTGESHEDLNNHLEATRAIG